MQDRFLFMDFLDPRKTRARKIQLIVGYVLVAIAIGLGTVILVYGTSGYGVNTKTGDIVQNGLLFVDSKPGGASIYLNNKSINSTTAARLVLPAANYNLKLAKTGYRDWQRSFQLNENTISRYVYPFLFPQKPVITPIKTFSSAPPLLTESPDHHWLLAQDPAAAGIFDEYDTSNVAKPVVALQVPAGILTDAGAAGSALKLVEWSTDNNNLLLQHSFAGGSEFVVFNRADPAKSFNVNKLFDINPTLVALRNKKADQLYIYQQDGGTLALGNVGNGTVAAAFLRHVLAFKPYGNDIVDYVTGENVAAGQAQARIWNKDKSYPLYTFAAGTKYLLDTASYSGNDYYAAGSDTGGRVNVYKNPLDQLKNPSIGKALPSFFLKADGATKVSFSDNARFVALQGGQNFGVYDFETGDRYEYTLKPPLDGPLQWMDGHRLISSSSNQIFVTDYDSTNQQTLAPTSTALGGYFSNDYNQLYTIAPVANSSSITLEHIDMRAGVDLPKNPNQ